MYQVLSKNRVRKMPEMKEPERNDYVYNESFEADRIYYERQLAKQTEFPISGNHNWKEGQLIEPNKDFEFGYDFSSIDQQQAQELGKEKENYKVVFPIPTQTEPSTGSEEDTAIKILTELCLLKNHKDTVGKDSFYEKTQPELWKRANDFLNKEEDKIAFFRLISDVDLIRKKFGAYIWAFPIKWRDEKTGKTYKQSFGWEVEFEDGKCKSYGYSGEPDLATYDEALIKAIEYFHTSNP